MYWRFAVEEILLLTVEQAAQAGDNLLISPPLPADQYEYELNGTQRVRIVTPDNQVLEKDAEISMPLGTRSRSHILQFPNTRASEIPVGSQISVKKS
jgi:hypothetical protein